jgi:hypothetical protein
MHRPTHYPVIDVAEGVPRETSGKAVGSCTNTVSEAESEINIRDTCSVSTGANLDSHG